MDNINPIVIVVTPLKNEAIARANQDANKIVADVQDQLKAANFDLNKVAPYPDSLRLSSKDYQIKKSKYNLFIKLTSVYKTDYRPNGETIVYVDEEKVQRFIKDSEEMAAIQYDMFINKLVMKVGDCVAAYLVGNHVWSYSFLTVMKEDGQKEVWKTQQIVNVSKLGLLFNQWPTRKVKR